VPESIDIREFDTGNLLYQSTLGARYQQRYGAPYYHIYRPDLHAILLGELLKRAPGAVEFDSAVAGFLEAADSVSVNLKSGRVEQGDCLIGADGIRSNIRTQLLGDTQVNWTGNVAWRGVLDASCLGSDFMDTVVSNFVGHKKHMVIYYLRAQKLINFVGVVKNPNWTNDSWVEKAPWQELKADYQGWHKLVQQVIDRVPKEQCYRWALCDHQPLGQWSSNRVTLLGDAAHATLPFLASGAVMAIEDAKILQRALDENETVERGLDSYQRNRLKRTAKIQNRSRQAGLLYHLPSRFMRRTVFKALNFRSGSNEHFLPEYDACTIPLV
ncbi:MAG: hypothetical protein HOM55_07095, partial [Proteobacteria bacterium]|nr:hypothetical protein [Pseudomonadota bacterium]